MVNQKLGNFLKKSKKIIVGVIGILLVLIVLPFLIPTEKYLAQFERTATEMLGVPVQIAHARLYFLPTPRLSVDGVVIGKQQDITIESISVVPSLSTLFSETRTIALHIHQPTIKDSAVAIISPLLDAKSDSSGPSPVEISSIEIDDLKLVWPPFKLPLFNAQASFAKGMQFLDAEINSEDGQLVANILPTDTGHSIVLKMQDWVMPLSKPFLVNEGRVDMALVGSQLDISKINMQLYGGSINGNAKLNWKKAWQLNGQLYVKDVSLKAPTKMLNPNTYMDGRLVGNGRFGANAKNAGQLMDQLRAEFTFTVNNGVLYGLDLVKIASLLIKQSPKGGQTQFDTFTGQLAISGKRYHLKRLQVSSGLISAKGEVKINEQEKLDGKTDVEIKQSVGLVSVPLVVSGTLQNPSVFPSKAALAGAAVGTAILGPGLGTSLGSKAGDAVKGLKDLFGGD